MTKQRSQASSDGGGVPVGCAIELLGRRRVTNGTSETQHAAES